MDRKWLAERLNDANDDPERTERRIRASPYDAMELGNPTMLATRFELVVMT